MPKVAFKSPSSGSVGKPRESYQDPLIGMFLSSEYGKEGAKPVFEAVPDGTATIHQKILEIEGQLQTLAVDVTEGDGVNARSGASTKHLLCIRLNDAGVDAAPIKDL